MGNLLESWLEQERQIRERMSQGVGYGVATRDQLAALTGLQMMQAMIEGRLPQPPIAALLDYLLVEVAEGSAVFQGSPGPKLLNPLGTVHGGWYATLLDSAMGCAVGSMMPLGRSYTTTELSVNLVRAIPSQVQRVRAEGRVLHCGRQLATADARLVGPDGTLYAHGTTTCLVFEMPGKV